MIRLMLAFLLLFSTAAQAGKLVYDLKPEKVADGVYVFLGSTDHFSLKNGGNIVNTGFIVGSRGVIVIDTGPSLRYGETMRAAIATITKKPIIKVIVTHDHPDHYLGNQAYKDRPIIALPATIDIIRADGDAVAEGMYAMVGDWMRGTEVVVPTEKAVSGDISIAGRKLKLLALDGHTDGDLAVFDVETGVLFAGDLTFFKRTPTFPSATIPQWRKALTTLTEIKFTVMVPGHGPIVKDRQAIDKTLSYMNWLDTILRDGVEQGSDMNEVMATDIPAPHNSWSVAREEFIRSVTYLYPKYEANLLPKISKDE